MRRAGETLWFGLLCVGWALFSVAAVFGVIEIVRAGAPRFSPVEILVGAAASLALCLVGMKLVGELWDRGRRIEDLREHQADAIARAREFEALEAVYAQQAQSQEEVVEQLRSELAERGDTVDLSRSRTAERRPQGLRRTA